MQPKKTVITLTSKVKIELPPPGDEPVVIVEALPQSKPPSCQMIARDTWELCKQKPHGNYCIQHQNYEKYIESGYTVDQIRNWERCTDCRTPFLKENPYWRVCFKCQTKQNSFYCKWYCRRELCEPKDMEPVRCLHQRGPGYLCSKDHSNIDPEWIGKAVKYCTGCRHAIPVEVFDKETCPICSGRSKEESIKRALVQTQIDLTLDHKCFTCDEVVSGIHENKYCKKCMYSRKINDGRKNWLFALSYDEAIAIMSSPCTYCNCPEFYVNSMDRVDSSIGYVCKNVVAACHPCNLMKNDCNVFDFINRCIHLSKYHNRKERPFSHLFDSKKVPVREDVYKRSAGERKHQYLLTTNEFQILTNQCCKYCGNGVNIGIDRVDSDGDYIFDNCVPCCKTCNQMKLNLSEQVFYEKFQQIAQRSDLITRYIREFVAKTRVIIQKRQPPLT